MSELHLALKGPFLITEVPYHVEPQTMGVYVLSRSPNGRPIYVGRSDSDLQLRIISSSSQGDYRYFWFDYASSPMDAYKYECELYHGFNPPDNSVHPAVPPNMNWRCPVQDCEWA